MGEGQHCNPGWLLSALLLRPPSRPRSPVRCGRREPEGSGLATLRRFREGRGRPRGCRTGPWPGRREWRAGWAASSWCQVRSAGRGAPSGQDGRLGNSEAGRPQVSAHGCPERDRVRRPAPGREPLAMVRCTPAALRCHWLDLGRTTPAPPHPPALSGFQAV